MTAQTLIEKPPFQPFELERLMSEWEQKVEFNLTESGVHPITLRELLTHTSGLRWTEDGVPWVQCGGGISNRPQQDQSLGERTDRRADASAGDGSNASKGDKKNKSNKKKQQNNKRNNTRSRKHAGS